MSKKNLQVAMQKREAAAKQKIQPADLYSADVEKSIEIQPEKKLEKNTTAKQLKAKSQEDEIIRYSTYVHTSTKKKIKLHAIERGIDDQDIVREALKEYFETHTL